MSRNLLQELGQIVEIIESPQKIKTEDLETANMTKKQKKEAEEEKKIVENINIVKNKIDKIVKKYKDN